MAVGILHDQKDTVYFITITCYKWIPLFAKTRLYDFIYEWFNRVANSGVKVLGYVIMPNHMHLLIYIPVIDKKLNQIIGEAKRFMAYEIIKRLKQNEDSKTLNLLSHSLSNKLSESGQKHRVFYPSFDARICETKEEIEQLLDYIHFNPVSGKWNLVDEYTSYPHSSAAFYELEEKSVVPLAHYLDFI
jgi:REP element-mobilizing transposase RayT